MIIYQEEKRRAFFGLAGNPVSRLCADVEEHIQTFVPYTTYLNSQDHVNLLICKYCTSHVLLFLIVYSLPVANETFSGQ